MIRQESIRIILMSVVIFMLLSPVLSSGRIDYAVRESRNCPYCHTREGPPQLNEAGVYYGMNNHSFAGFIPSPKITPTPVPAEEVEIGVHMNTWDVGISAMVIILLILALVYAIRL